MNNSVPPIMHAGVDDVSRSAAEALSRALTDAELAAARVGVQVRVVDDSAGYQYVADVLQRIWEYPDGAPLPPSLLKALGYCGNYVAVAFEHDTPVGAAMGFHTAHGALHSHIAGVLPSHQGRSVGYALKLHQRAWALQHGISVMAWTFDPLIRRNAHFNLVKLGAEVVDYLPDFYGEMTDHINAGDHSDRLLVEWDLRRPVPGETVVAGPDAPYLLTAGPGGRPETHAAASDEWLLQLPPDIETIRHTDPELARSWRAALRAALAEVFKSRHRIVGFDARHAYVTRRVPS